jgi:glycosyltransferase involved in cell wall biosynthesis
LPEVTEISVVVCTYNRAVLLDRLFDSLSQQTLDKKYWQLILVDNNSLDNTKGVVAKWQPSLPLIYVEEHRQGLSYARNTGLFRSDAPVVSYVDDDCMVSSNWLKAMLNGYERFPGTACFGGRTFLNWEGGVKPSWMPDKVMPVLGFHDFGETIIEVRHINGTNMAWVRSVLVELGGFNPSLGRIGNRKLAAEESEVQEKARNFGYSIRYLPDALAYHWMPLERQSSNHTLHLCFMVGKSASTSDRINDSNISNVMRFLHTTKSLTERFFTFLRSLFQEMFIVKDETIYNLHILMIAIGKWWGDLTYFIIPNKK